MKKRTIQCIVAIAVMALFMPLQSMAQRGGGPGDRFGQTPGGPPGDRPQGPPPFEEILDGTPFDITGEIVSILFPKGMEISTVDGNVVIRGTGPDEYYETLGVDVPTVGETVQVTGYIVASPEGDEHYVAMTITVGGQEVELRDPETGEPVWHAGRPERPRPGDRPEPNQDITAGTPFDVTGDVSEVMPPHGLVLSTTDGNVDLFGIGPAKYWEDQGVELPEVGGVVQVEGYIVEFDGLERYIAMSMTVNGVTIELRDSEDGAPLWRPERPERPEPPAEEL